MSLRLNHPAVLTVLSHLSTAHTGAKMLKNPGARYHHRQAATFRRWAKKSDNAFARANLYGKAKAHEKSEEQSRALGLNPVRRHPHTTRKKGRSSMNKILGMSPIVAAIVGVGVYRWYMGLPIIPTSLNPLAGLGELGEVNAFPRLSGSGAFPSLGDIHKIGVEDTTGIDGPMSRQVIVRNLPHSRLR